MNTPIKMRLLIQQAAIITLVSQAALSAQTVNWGATGNFLDSSNTRFYDSAGVPLGSSFIWDVGTFLNNFTPTLANINDWKSNWLSLATDTIDTGVPWNFGGSADITSNLTNGHIGYIWGYDNINNPTETVLWTGNPSEWRLPTFGSAELPPNLSTTNARNVIVGRIDTDLADNAAGVITGGGTFTGNPANPWEIQTASVPESSVVLIGAAGGLLIFAKRRRS